MCKGKLDKPTDVGRTLSLAQNISGAYANHHPHQDNPNDTTALVPLVKRLNAARGRE